MRNLIWSFLPAMLLSWPNSSCGADLAKINRTITKEPLYKGTPKYCLLVFGPVAKFRAWLVTDDEALYVDRNGNGDLTENGKRVPRTRNLNSPVRAGHFDF